MKHSIVITSEKKGLATIPVRQHIKRCITAALDVQGVDVPCEINVLVTDDAGIRAINKAYRDIDRATDVLSFPMFEQLSTASPFCVNARSPTVRHNSCVIGSQDRR